MSEQSTPWDRSTGPELIRSEGRSRRDRGSSEVSRVDNVRSENIRSDTRSKWDEIVGPDIVRARDWVGIRDALEMKHFIFPSVIPYLTPKTIDGLRRHSIPNSICDLLLYQCVAAPSNAKKPAVVNVSSCKRVIGIESETEDE